MLPLKNSSRLAVILAVLSTSHLAVAGDSSPFKIKIPDGWTDLSAAAPVANFEGLPAEIAAQARSGKYAAVAIDRRSGEPIRASFNAIVEPNLASMNTAFLTRFTKDYLRMVPKSGSGARIEFREKQIASIAGVKVARFVVDAKAGKQERTVLIFVIPNSGQRAVLTYATKTTQFDAYRPALEKAASLTVAASKISP